MYSRKLEREKRGNGQKIKRCGKFEGPALKRGGNISGKKKNNCPDRG